jgi:hypothetical protein
MAVRIDEDDGPGASGGNDEPVQRRRELHVVEADGLAASGKRKGLRVKGGQAGSRRQHHAENHAGIIRAGTYQESLR